MPAKEILVLGNPALRTRCAPVRRADAADVLKDADDLRDTLDAFRKEHGFGRGIAAPQIGLTRRIVFISVDRLLAMINPVIVRRSRRMFTLWDDCFSLPDLLAKVKRHVTVEVQYQDPSGKTRTVRAEGGLSELLQHEIDHLDGILMIDRAIDSRHIVYRSEFEKRFGTKGPPAL